MSINLQVGLIKEIYNGYEKKIQFSYTHCFSVNVDGTVLLLYLPPNSPYPNDGIRWQDNEVKSIIPAGPRVRTILIHALSFSLTPFFFFFPKKPGTRGMRTKIRIRPFLRRNHRLSSQTTVPSPQRRESPACVDSLYARTRDDGASCDRESTGEGVSIESD